MQSQSDNSILGWMFNLAHGWFGGNVNGENDSSASVGTSSRSTAPQEIMSDLSDFGSDLGKLKVILTNEKLSNAQRNLELRDLSLDKTFRNSQDRCALVIKMFNTVPQAKWPYLFKDFQPAIVYWSLPRHKEPWSLFKKSPAPQKNTWVCNVALWSDILVGTLNVIAEMKDDLSDEGDVACRSLSHVEEALSRSNEHIDGFSNIILKKFFLNDIAKNVHVLARMMRYAESSNREPILNDKLLASWLPVDPKQRIAALAPIFTDYELSISESIALERFLKAPYVRNDTEQKHLMVRIVNTRKRHIINFIEQFSWDVRKLIIQSNYQINPSMTESLLVTAMNEFLEYPHPQQDFAMLFQSTYLLLSILEYTEINLTDYINKIAKRDKLINIISSFEYWNQCSPFNVRLLFQLNAVYDPDNFYSKVTRYFESTEKKCYLDLYAFTHLFENAQNIAIPPYKSYMDYLNSHAEDKIKYVKYIQRNISTFIIRSDVSAMKLANALIPDFERQILDQIAFSLEGSTLADVNYSPQRIRAFLNNLAQVKGIKGVLPIKSIFSQNKKNHQLSEEGKQFADKYLNSSKPVSFTAAIEYQYNDLDRISQLLLADQFEELKTEQSSNLDLHNLDLLRYIF